MAGKPTGRALQKQEENGAGPRKAANRTPSRPDGCCRSRGGRENAQELVQNARFRTPGPSPLLFRALFRRFFHRICEEPIRFVRRIPTNEASPSSDLRTRSHRARRAVPEDGWSKGRRVGGDRWVGIDGRNRPERTRAGRLFECKGGVKWLPTGRNSTSRSGSP